MIIQQSLTSFFHLFEANYSTCCFSFWAFRLTNKVNLSEIKAAVSTIQEWTLGLPFALNQTDGQHDTVYEALREFLPNDSINDLPTPALVPIVP